MFLAKLKIIETANRLNASKTARFNFARLFSSGDSSAEGSADSYMQTGASGSDSTASTAEGMRSKFPQAEPGTKLFIGNLDHQVTDSVLQETFAAYGSLKEANVIMNKFTGRSRGYGFVTFESVEDAETAMNTLNNTEFQGRTLTVKTFEARAPSRDKSSYGSYNRYPPRRFENSGYQYRGNSYYGNKQTRYPSSGSNYSGRSSGSSYYGSNRQGYYQNKSNGNYRQNSYGQNDSSY